MFHSLNNGVRPSGDHICTRSLHSSKSFLVFISLAFIKPGKSFKKESWEYCMLYNEKCNSCTPKVLCVWHNYFCYFFSAVSYEWHAIKSNKTPIWLHLLISWELAWQIATKTVDRVGRIHACTTRQKVHLRMRMVSTVHWKLTSGMRIKFNELVSCWYLPYQSKHMNA